MVGRKLLEDLFISLLFQERPASERERRKKIASYESKSGLTWGQPAYTQAHTHATLYIHEEAKGGSLISSSFVLYLIFENRVLPPT